MVINHRVLATPAHRAPIEQWVRYYKFEMVARN